jgi:hypothetical protein
MAEKESQPVRRERAGIVMGYERALNAVWLGLLIVATWIFWSLRAAAILLGLFIAGTIIGIWMQRKKK